MKLWLFTLLLLPVLTYASSQSSLTGMWSQVRSQSSSHDCEGNQPPKCGWMSESRDNKVVFKGSEFDRFVIGYSEKDRKLKAWVKEVVGVFTSTNITQSGVIELNINFKSVQLIPMNGATVALWNRIKFCGKQNWESQVSQDVTGLMCDPLPMRVPGSTYYTSVGIQNSKLYFANDSDEQDGSSPENRPTKLDLTNPLIREK